MDCVYSVLHVVRAMTAPCESPEWAELYNTLVDASVAPDTQEIVQAIFAELRRHQPMQGAKMLATAILVSSAIVDSVLAIEPMPEKKRIIVTAVSTALARELQRKLSDQIAASPQVAGNA
jgi:hypothetical protein